MIVVKTLSWSCARAFTVRRGNGAGQIDGQSAAVTIEPSCQVFDRRHHEDLRTDSCDLHTLVGNRYIAVTFAFWSTALMMGRL